MCGIAGIARPEPTGVAVSTLVQMAASIRHRGPDGYGYFAGRQVGLAHVRLSIIDVAHGAQPMANENGRVLVAYNGEIFNFVELRSELRSLGHQFQTECDTEVLVHGYEEWGSGMLARLNGQFAFSIYDRRDGTIFLARDRFGVHPLFYAVRNRTLYFASEVKAIFASGEIEARPDPRGLDEVFTFWGARAPRTPFQDVRCLEPGTYATWRNGELIIRRYFDPAYPEAADEPPNSLDLLDRVMRTSVDLRMRADVPVGAYLSGGLDSSITSSLAAASSPYELRTFSVSFEDPALDESEFQRLMAARIGSRHTVETIRSGDVAAVFPDVVHHAETPLVRSGPAPMYLLSKLTRENGIKVVLTGEGSDEFFLGYDLFKETKVRRFCLSQPGSSWRPMLFDRLYPYLGGKQSKGGEFWRGYFMGAGDGNDPLFSHLPRFLLTARIKEFYSGAMREELDGFDALDELRSSLPDSFYQWSPLNKAAYLELTTLLPSYLLSSQGDRMAMAHGVEARFPFLDHRLFDLSATLPTRSKLRGLREKDILRRWAADVVPSTVLQRPKQPYRSPDIPAFFGESAPGYVREMLDSSAVAKSGFFDPRAVSGLVSRAVAGRATGFRENQALVAILSTQIWAEQFFARPNRYDEAALGRLDVAMLESEASASLPVPAFN